ncbi:MAG: right-handed parallel beta-helix repeat-containing protein, partial [Pseudomonadota bacterium]
MPRPIKRQSRSGFKSSRKSRRLKIEGLESRQMLTTVTTLSDIVDPSDGETSLREAVVDVPDGGTIDFAVSGTIQLIDTLRVEKSLTIDGSDEIELRGRPGFSVVNISDSDSSTDHHVVLHGLEITQGRNGISSSESLTIVNSTIDDNRFTGLNGGGDFMVVDSTISSNGAGGIRAFGNLTISGSTISENVASIGGGIRASNLTIENSTVSGNSAQARGGGIYVTSTAVLYNTTLSGNSSASGAGIYGGEPLRGAEIRIHDSTITNNIATDAGGGVYISQTGNERPFQSSNSIIAGNKAAVYPDLRIDPGSQITVNHSLIGNSLGSTLGSASIGEINPNGNIIGTRWVPIDPLLGPLADNGGGTATHALLPGSPALDAGQSTRAQDQRGLDRTVDLPSAVTWGDGNATDMGAVERQSLNGYYLPSEFAFVTATTLHLDFHAAHFASDSSPLTVTLTLNEGEFLTPSDGTAFDVAANLSDPQTITLVGSDLNINRYLDVTNLRYRPGAGAVGDDFGEIDVQVDDGTSVTDVGTILIDITEARSLEVNSSSDVTDPFDGQTTLREAVATANLRGGPDTITFDSSLQGSRIVMNGSELEITESLHLDASGANPVTIDAAQQSRILRFTSIASGDLSISGLTLTGGDTEGTGGAIMFESDGDLTLTNSLVSGNRSTGGGGIHTSSGDIELLGSEVSNNTADFGGGLSGRRLFIFDSRISGNSGGGISSWRLNMFNSSVAENTEGAGVSASHAVIDHSSVSLNEGGGIVVDDFYSSLELTDSIVVDNSSQNNGGGIFVDRGSVLIRSSTISGNTSMGHGGGVYIDSTRESLVIESTTISGNSSNGNGGGLFLDVRGFG